MKRLSITLLTSLIMVFNINAQDYYLHFKDYERGLDNFNQQNPKFEHSEFKQPGLEQPYFPPKKTKKNAEDWWEPDTMYFFNENSELTGRYIWEYNENGTVTLHLYQIWKNNEWKNKWKNTYTYDSNNKLLIKLSESFGNELWENNKSKYSYSYDSYDNQLTSLYETWNSYDNYWLSENKTTNTYDANNNLLTEFYEDFVPIAMFPDSIRNSYTYDSNNNRLTAVTDFCYDGFWLYNRRKYIYTYDSNNNLITELYLPIGGFSWKKTYTYDSKNNLITELEESLYNEEWSNSWKKTYTYDANNNKLTELSQSCSNNVCVNNEKLTYSYDSNNNLITLLSQNWINENWANIWKFNYNFDFNNCSLSEFWVWQNEGWESENGGHSIFYNNS